MVHLHWQIDEFARVESAFLSAKHLIILGNCLHTVTLEMIPLHAQFSFDDCSVPLNLLKYITSQSSLRLSQQPYSRFFPPTKWCCLCDPLISVLILPFPHSFTRSRHASLVPSFTKYSQKDPIPKLSTHHLRHSSRFRLVLAQVTTNSFASSPTWNLANSTSPICCTISLPFLWEQMKVFLAH